MNRSQQTTPSIIIIVLAALALIWVLFAQPAGAGFPVESNDRPDAPAAALDFSGTVFDGPIGNETPLPGVTVQLYGAQNTSNLGTWLRNATSGPDGTYSMGTNNTAYAYYNIIEIVPASYAFLTAVSRSGGTVVGQTIRFSSPSPGTYGENEFYNVPLPTATPTPAATATPSSTRTSTATATTTATGTATNTPTATATPNVGNLQGTVWNDLNGNATKDAGEPGLAGAQVILRDNGNNLIGSHTTGSDGFYSFPDLTPGSYSVVEVDPSGYVSTTPNNWVIPISANSTLTLNFGDWIPVTFTATPTGTATPTTTPSVTPSATATLPPSAVVVLAVAPATSNVSVDDIFTVDIQVQAGVQAVDAVDAFLNFDPVYLRVVDAGGTPTNTITAGPAFNTVLLNQVDNAQGQIDFSGAMLGGTPPSGTFTLATVRFKALAGNISGTTVSFSTTPPRQSEAAFAGQSVLASTSPGLMIIGGPTATPSGTATRTATATTTASATGTATATVGPSATSTATATVTATETTGPSPTTTPTNTPSPVGTIPSATASPTPGLDLSSAIPVSCGSYNSGDTQGNHQGVSQYGCRIWNESGPEQVYVLNTTVTQTITATLSDFPPLIDLDVFILSDPNPSACVGVTNDTFAVVTNAPPGTYYIVVDGFEGDSGPYALDISCPLEPQQATATPTLTPTPTMTATPTVTPGGFKTLYLPVIRLDPSPTPTPTSTPNPYDLGVNAGGPVYTDTTGFVWQADAKYGTSTILSGDASFLSWLIGRIMAVPPAGTWGYDPGTVVPEGQQVGTTDHLITNTSDATLYETERWGMQGYRFDVPTGRYDVELHFAEIFRFYENPGDRYFDVYIENQLALDKYDIIGDAGKYTAAVKRFPGIPVADGRLDIDIVHYWPNTGYGKLSAVRVIYGGP